MSDELFDAGPTGPKVAPPGDLAPPDDERSGAEPPTVATLGAGPPVGAQAPAAAPGLGRVPLRLAVLAVGLASAIGFGQAGGIDESRGILVASGVLVYALTWLPLAGVAFVLGLAGVGRRGLRAALLAWPVVAVPAGLWALLLLAVVST